MPDCDLSLQSAGSAGFYPVPQHGPLSFQGVLWLRWLL